MKQSMQPWSVKQLIKMLERNSLDFNSPIQRKPGQWSLNTKSLLIHSILSEYIIPACFLRKEPTGEVENGKAIFSYSVIDGKQRQTTVFEFVNGEYSLDWDTPSYVNDDGEEIELAGKLFTSLPTATQEDILRYNFKCYNIEDATDEEIEENFNRLNNGVALNKNQKIRTKLGFENARIINDIMESNFFNKCRFSEKQEKSADDEAALIQGLMLLVKYEYEDFTADTLLKFCSEYRDKISDENKKELVAIVDYLDRVFDEIAKSESKYLKKINLPMVMLMAQKAMNTGVKEVDFRVWFNSFFAKYQESGYALQCGAGSIRLSKVRSRIQIMERDFDAYFGKVTETKVAETVSDSEPTGDSVKEDEVAKENNAIENSDKEVAATVENTIAATLEEETIVEKKDETVENIEGTVENETVEDETDETKSEPETNAEENNTSTKVEESPFPFD